MSEPEKANDCLFDFVSVATIYSKYCTDANVRYAEIMALQDLGFELGKKVVHLIRPKRVFHRSYVAFIGPSTIARKDTIQELLGQDLIPVEKQITNTGSTEGYLEDLIDLGESGFELMGEWSKELKGIKKENWRGEFAEFKNDMFNCKRIRKRLSSGEKRRKNGYLIWPYLCINTTCTPEVLLENLRLKC